MLCGSFSLFSSLVIHLSCDVVILRGVVVRNPWTRTFVPMDTKNFCAALRFNPHSESRVSEWHRGHGLRRRWRAKTQDPTRNIKALGHSTWYSHDQGVQAPCGASTRCLWCGCTFVLRVRTTCKRIQIMIRQLLSVIAATSMECSRVAIVLCGRNEVWPTRSLAKRGFEPSLSFSSSSPASAPLPSLASRRPPSPASAPRTLGGDAWQLSFAVELAAVPASWLLLAPFSSREAPSVSVFSLSCIFSQKPK